MQSNEYPFRLEKHPKKKGECPNCGHSKTWRYYEDLAGNTLEEFGICDRVNNCGEHRPPKGIKSEGKEALPPPPQPVQIFPQDKQLARIQKALTNVQSRLHTFLSDKLGITVLHFQKWCLGGEFNKTVFVFKDREGRYVNLKTIIYNDNGHRNKEFDALSLKQPVDPLTRYQLCLYGEHLLDPEKKKPVIVVESEKTALIASFFYTRYDWVACAANTGLTDAKIPALFGRRVVWLCDADVAGRRGKFNSSIRKLEAYQLNHAVVDPFPERIDGYDIADHIIDQKGEDLLDLPALIKAAWDKKTLPEASPEQPMVDETPVASPEPTPDLTELEPVTPAEVLVTQTTDIAPSEIPIIPDEIDDLLFDVAMLIVADQECSTSFIQRKFKLGFNRANRIMDQLVAIQVVSQKIYNEPQTILFDNPDVVEIHLQTVLKTKSDDHAPAETPITDPVKTKPKKGKKAQKADNGSSHDPEPTAESDDDDEDFELIEEDDEVEQVGIPRDVWQQPDIRKNFRKYGFVEYAGKYWFATFDEKNYMYKFKPGSNFIIRPLFLIISKSNPKRIYEVKNCWKKSKVVDLDPGEFVQLDGFRKNVESQGNFIFMGNAMQFMKVKSKLFDQSKEAEEVKTLGYHKDGFYAFANGIQSQAVKKGEKAPKPGFTALDKDGYGIVEHGDKRYFIPPLSRIYMNDDDEYQNAKKFIYNKGVISFKDYAQLFVDVHGDNGRIGLLYYISCLFRDIIFDRFRCFPHLFLFGPPQTGKSTMAWSMSYLFGHARPPFALNTGTSVGFYKHFAEFRNAVVWFDEYLNSIDWGRVQSLKTAYDGNGHTKSDMTKDNRNKSIPVSSGCIVSGQELPTADIALFTRCILLQYDRTEFTQEERQRLDAFHLQGKNLDFGHITAELSIHRDTVEKNFFEIYNTQFDILKSSFSKHGIDDRLVKNMSVLIAMFESLKDILEFPFTTAEIRATASQMLRKQNSLIAGSKETSTFWNLVEYMYRTSLIKDNGDFVIKSVPSLTVYENGESTEKLLDGGRPKRVLYMRLSKIQPLYLELHRKQYGKNGLDSGSLKHYLEHSKGFYGSIRNVKFGGAPTSALAFDYEYLTDTMDGFSLEGFGEQMESDPAPVASVGTIAETEAVSVPTARQGDIPF
jgi:hypothetical protein